MPAGASGGALPGSHPPEAATTPLGASGSAVDMDYVCYRIPRKSSMKAAAESHVVPAACDVPLVDLDGVSCARGPQAKAMPARASSVAGAGQDTPAGTPADAMAIIGGGEGVGSWCCALGRKGWGDV